MANRYGLEPDKFLSTLKGTIFPAGGPPTNEQIAAFLVVANEFQLNPFIKEIYAFPSKGGITPIVSIDGWLTIINRQPMLDGIEFEDRFDDNGKLSAVTAKIYRKDRAKPTEVTEYMAECHRNTEPWNKWPARMLRHKALIQCGRYAFGLAGIYDPDEAERIAETEAPDVQNGNQIGIAGVKQRLLGQPTEIESEITAPDTEEAPDVTNFVDAGEPILEDEAEPEAKSVESQIEDWRTAITDALRKFTKDKRLEVLAGRDPAKIDDLQELSDLYEEIARVV